MQALINLFTVKNEISFLLLIDLTHDNYPRVLDKGNLSSNIWTLSACAWNIEASLQPCPSNGTWGVISGGGISTYQGLHLQQLSHQDPFSRFHSQPIQALGRSIWGWGRSLETPDFQTHQNSSPNLHLDMTPSPSNRNKWCTLRIFSAGSHVRWL